MTSRTAWVAGLGLTLVLQAWPARAAVPRPDAEYTRTRYPIVLVPGAILFHVPVSAWTFWYGIVEALQEGGAEVFVSALPMGSDDVRGQELLEQIERIVKLTGAPKVNLFGYSQGGQTARYAAHAAPHWVASVTTIATPHQGSPLAAFVAEEGGSQAARLARQLLRTFLFGLSRHATQIPHDRKAFDDALASLSVSGAQAFNARFPHGLPAQPCDEGPPEVDGQRYYSWGGVGVLTNPLDLSDAIFLVTASQFKHPHDGMIERCSSHFGKVIRDNYPQNHFDEINQMFGLSSWKGVNPKIIYRSHANRLKNAGL